MIPFTESLRYNYPLTPDSLVIDGGAYEGNFAKLIAEKYGCPVYAYEPIHEFYEGIVARLPTLSVGHLIHPRHAGLSGLTGRRELFGVKGDMSGADCTSSNRQESVTLLPIATVIHEHAGPDRDVALLKLNIEGGEYEVIEALLDTGLIHRIRHLQVQPHNLLPEHPASWERLRAWLAATHTLTWDAPWCWSNFKRRA